MTTNPTPATVGDALIALLRTVVPTVVGYILALLAQSGLGLPAGTSAILDLLLTAVFTGTYYALVRWLSTKWSWVGWFLGWPTNPTYSRE